MKQLRAILAEHVPAYDPAMSDDEAVALFHSWSLRVVSAATDATRTVLIEATRILKELAVGVAGLAEVARDPADRWRA